MTESYPYERKLIALIDILGFSALVKNADHDAELRKQIFEKLYFLQGVKDLSAYFKYDLKELPPESRLKRISPLEITAVSDCIILSAPVSEDGFCDLLGEVNSICHGLSFNYEQYGMGYRGGITIGHITHKESLVFGTGYLRAVELEKRACDAAIILIDNNVVNEPLLKCAVEPLISHAWEECEEGMYRCHPFSGTIASLIERKKRADLGCGRPCPGIEGALSEWRELIVRELSTDISGKERDKWCFLAKKYNETLEKAAALNIPLLMNVQPIEQELVIARKALA